MSFLLLSSVPKQYPVLSMLSLLSLSLSLLVLCITAPSPRARSCRYPYSIPSLPPPLAPRSVLLPLHLDCGVTRTCSVQHAHTLLSRTRCPLPHSRACRTSRARERRRRAHRLLLPSAHRARLDRAKALLAARPCLLRLRRLALVGGARSVRLPDSRLSATTRSWPAGEGEEASAALSREDERAAAAAGRKGGSRRSSRLAVRLRRRVARCAGVRVRARVRQRDGLGDAHARVREVAGALAAREEACVRRVGEVLWRGGGRERWNGRGREAVRFCVASLRQGRRLGRVEAALDAGELRALRGGETEGGGGESVKLQMQKGHSESRKLRTSSGRSSPALKPIGAGPRAAPARRMGGQLRQLEEGEGRLMELDAPRLRATPQIK